MFHYFSMKEAMIGYFISFLTCISYTKISSLIVDRVLCNMEGDRND